jgi:hypothetical protein
MAVKRLVTRTPQTWTGTIAEAVFGTAGRSIIVGREWFRFKKGRGLVNSDAAVVTSRDEFCVIRAGEVSNEEIEALRRMTGRKWSPLFNCLTAFAPFWEGRMSRITPGDRDSIARYVVIVFFLCAALTVGSGYLINHWVDSKIDPLRNSMSKHFGDVKKMIRELEDR